MKCWLTSLILVATMPAYAEGPPLAKSVSSIEVSVRNLRNQTGTVVYCLWRETDPGFPRCDSGSPFKKQNAPASFPTTFFPEIPQGIYAISLFHDEAGTGKIETNFLGMPRSGIGISGGLTRPPNFSKAKFSVPTNGPIVITVNYR